MIQNDYGCGLMMVDGHYCSSLGSSPHLCSNCQLRLLNQIRYDTIPELLDKYKVPSNEGNITLTTKGRILRLLRQRERFVGFVSTAFMIGLALGSVFAFSVLGIVLYLLP